MHDAHDLPTGGIPILGIVAWSGTGKTTLIEALLPRLRARGWPTAVIKHAHHAFDIDTPGKDSHRLRQAGAAPMVVASGQRYALMMETPGADEPDLPALVAQVAALGPALILVEGFKTWPLPKLELVREPLGQPPLARHDPWVHGLAIKPGLTSEFEAVSEAVVRLDIDDVDAIVEWMIAWAAEGRGA
ncbi:molybdopterin-guanine dinucleotide biosynthesis protein B [Salinicola avicenniae]|uniref:molybdopterin-guanine dinucleotide biosynthesis protein B n=1 Tax=Salinicola avicenniae TaxID=2916836 RepID=UPI0020730B05|nr:MULTISPECIES: molybdopterin-guanine dinucleotide biosynthesis protein B [unclassified Salinicola]